MLALIGSARGRAAAPLQIYFPPTPPPLGAPRPAPEKSPWPAPPALAAYIGAPFYAPLSTRLARQEIGDDLAYALQVYNETKLALLSELRAELDLVRDINPEKRKAAVIDFARRQTPRIAAWEASGETLREQLCAEGSAPAELKRWFDPMSRLTVAERGSAEFQSALVRFAQYYQAGLSLDQRQLLREMAVELAPPQTPPDPAFAHAWGFSPEPARILTPANAPPDLLHDIARYRSEKVALERELLQTLIERFGTGPAAEWTALAAAEAPRFDALETQAEHIRIEMARLADPVRPPEMPRVPPDLARRISGYRTEKLALQRGLLTCADAARRDAPPSTSDFDGRVRKAIDRYQQYNAARYAALAKEGDSIREALGRLMQPPAGGSADALIAGFSRSVRRLEGYWDYRDYQTAALLPGLSPEQRRLLFQGALEKLALPLPGAAAPIGSR